MKIYLVQNMGQKGKNCRRKDEIIMSKNIKSKPSKKANGEGTIYFSESKNTWVGQIVLGKKEDGSLKRITRYGKTKKIVREKLKEVEFQYKTGTLVDRSKVTINIIMEQYINDMKNMNTIKESTYYRHLETLKAISPIANIPMQDLTIMAVKQFLISLVDKYSQSSIDKQYQMIKRSFAIAKKRGIIAEDFFEDDELKVPKSSQVCVKVRGLTIDEQKKLQQVLENDRTIPYRNQMLLSMMRGMRIGEINALEVQDVNFLFHTITITKTVATGNNIPILHHHPKTDAGVRTIKMSSAVENLLRESIGKKTEGFIFTRNDKLITANQVNSCFSRILKKYDILDPNEKGKVSMHSLRHTYATRCIEAGMPTKVLQTTLGHKDIKITLNTYCDVFDKFENKHLEKVDEYIEAIFYGRESVVTQKSS